MKSISVLSMARMTAKVLWVWMWIASSSSVSCKDGSVRNGDSDSNGISAGNSDVGEDSCFGGNACDNGIGKEDIDLSMVIAAAMRYRQ
jgi:hypothetical protein